jgi:sterol desaturase/sphingolipid hydroxylase (fatty acid hydroxylase superfamily)
VRLRIGDAASRFATTCDPQATLGQTPRRMSWSDEDAVCDRRQQRGYATMVILQSAITHGLWPLVVVAGVAVVLLVVNIGTLGIVLVAEQLAPHRREWSPLTDRQSINDLGHGLLQSQLGERIGGLVLFAVATTSITVRAPLSIWPIEWPMALQVLLGIVIADGLDYWKHRALHTVWGWRLHALHHGITRLHALRAARSHFGEVALRFLLVYAPLVAVGAPHAVLFWHAAIIGSLGMIGHSNARLRLPSPVHWLLMTPHVHRLHHSNERAIADTNFANILPLWDVLFGTFSHPDEHVLRGVGIIGDETPESFTRQLLAPFGWSWPVITTRPGDSR